MATPKTTFTRDATGLVREVSVWNGFWMNCWAAGGPWVSLLWLSIYPIWFPEANLLLALFITTILSTIIGAMYVFIVNVMPRSGSDYVFASRTLHPSIGLGFSVNLVFWLMTVCAFQVYTTFGFISNTIFSLSAMLGSPGLLSAWASSGGSTTGTVVIGVGFFIAAWIIVAFGVRAYSRYVQNAVVAISIVAFAVVLVSGLIYTNNDFILRFNMYMSPLSQTADPYHDIIKLAASLGYSPSTSFDWGQTLSVSTLWWFITAFPMTSAWMAGEVKQASNLKAQFIAMSGGQWFTMLIAGVFVLIWTKEFNLNWLAALGYIAINSPGNIPAWISGASVSGTFFQLPWVDILLNNPILVILVSGAFILQTFIEFIPVTLAASRHIFAWSFDRVVPTKLSEVNERLHSPIFATTLIVAGGVIAFIISVYTSWLYIPSVGAPLGQVFGYISISVASIVFAWREKDVFSRSVVAKLKLAGLPLMTVVGAVSLVIFGMFLALYETLLSTYAVGGVPLAVSEIAISLYLVGIVGYFISKAIQKRRGIQLEMAFAEIPPE